MKNKRAKQMIVDIIVPNRKMYWFGERTEKFIADSMNDVIEMHRDCLGDDDVDDIISRGDFGELTLETCPKYWFKRLGYDVDEGKAFPTINAILPKGCYQVSTAYL
jgi:hypothetical protein